MKIPKNVLVGKIGIFLFQVDEMFRKFFLGMLKHLRTKDFSHKSKTQLIKVFELNR